MTALRNGKKISLFNSNHISSNEPDRTAILVGTNTLSRGGTLYLAKKFIIHEKYDENLSLDDVGLILLKNPIEFNDRVQPAPLSDRKVKEKSVLVVTGWGQLAVKYFTHMKILHKIFFQFENLLMIHR